MTRPAMGVVSLKALLNQKLEWIRVFEFKDWKTYFSFAVPRIMASFDLSDENHDSVSCLMRSLTVLTVHYAGSQTSFKRIASSESIKFPAMIPLSLKCRRMRNSAYLCPRVRTVHDSQIISSVLLLVPVSLSLPVDKWQERRTSLSSDFFWGTDIQF